MSRVVFIPSETFDDPIFKDEPYGLFEAFLWLSQVWDGTRVHLISKRMKWPDQKLWRFLSKLIEGGYLARDQFADVELFYRKKSARVQIPSCVKVKVLARDGSRCRYCGDEEGPFHYDHVMPWSKGGDNSASNLVVACRSCNLAKSDKTLDELGWSL